MSTIQNPCPFCFSDNMEVYRKGFGTGRRFQVLCRDCGARGPAKDTESEAINEWNGLQRTVNLMITGHVMQADAEKLYHLGKDYEWHEGPYPEED